MTYYILDVIQYNRVRGDVPDRLTESRQTSQRITVSTFAHLFVEQSVEIVSMLLDLRTIEYTQAFDVSIFIVGINLRTCQSSRMLRLSRMKTQVALQFVEGFGVIKYTVRQ